MNAPLILDIYDRLTQAADDRARARIIAEAFAQLEERYPHLPELVTRTHLSETELKLIKEIEQVRSEQKETELKLIKEIDRVRLEIEQVRSEQKEIELKLTQQIDKVRLEIEQVRSEQKENMLKLTQEIEQVRGEVKALEVRLVQAIHRQTVWVILAIGGVTGFVLWLDVLMR